MTTEAIAIKISDSYAVTDQDELLLLTDVTVGINDPELEEIRLVLCWEGNSAYFILSATEATEIASALLSHATAVNRANKTEECQQTKPMGHVRTTPTMGPPKGQYAELTESTVAVMRVRREQRERELELEQARKPPVATPKSISEAIMTPRPSEPRRLA
jgi:hypothetical protein